MKRIILLLIINMLVFKVGSQTVVSISQARTSGAGSTVTVRGIVTNGPELGSIRYMQDSNAGLAIYGSNVTGIKRGDSIQVTGTLSNYDQLLEMNPVTSIQRLDSGKALPTPVEISISQIGERYEGMLIKIKDVVFAAAGNNFGYKQTYTFGSNGQNGEVYTSSTLLGTVLIPPGNVTVIGILSQYDRSNPAVGYQLLPRDGNDIISSGSIYFTNKLSAQNATKTGINLTWTTNIPGTTEVKYGRTPALEMAPLKIAESVVGHSANITEMSAGDMVYVNAFTVNNTDTAYSGLKVYATISNSTGKINTYFNTPVDTTLKKWEKAIYVYQAIDDTLISYINRAKQTIDIAIYSFNNYGINNIATALKNAATRGVEVRVIVCGTTNSEGVGELTGSAVHFLVGPDASHRNGIMHNKFVVFDANATDPSFPLVWTGSTNFTQEQIDIDPNNVIILQDQSLARAYTIEFEEMWGSNSPSPDSALARFGSQKLDNTPHEFIIGGRRVESYFSPSDGTNQKIIDCINTTNKDLSISTMLCTQTEIGDPISLAATNGAMVNMLCDVSQKEYTSVNTILQAALGAHFITSDYIGGIMHNKYMIVDESNPGSDPQVLTGSHNWSASANSDNDENTLIVHDSVIANVYFQAFVKLFTMGHGSLIDANSPPVAVMDQVTISEDSATTIGVLKNDTFKSLVNLEIYKNPNHGVARLTPASDAISYVPETGFTGTDTFVYKISYVLEPSLSSLAFVIVKIKSATGIESMDGKNNVSVFPNPFVDKINIRNVSMKRQKAMINVYNMNSEKIWSRAYLLNEGVNNIQMGLEWPKGIYLIQMISDDRSESFKVIKE